MMSRRPRRTKAEMEALTAQVSALARQGFGMTETARLLGEHRPIIHVIRRRLGLTEPRRYRPKAGDPERAERLLRALKGFWEQSDLEWPEIARRCGTTQSTVWCWYEGKRKPCEASLDKVERFLSDYRLEGNDARQAQSYVFALRKGEALSNAKPGYPRAQREAAVKGGKGRDPL
jgi:transcriptional regulator with XRE-family HTH domain